MFNVSSITASNHLLHLLIKPLPLFSLEIDTIESIRQPSPNLEVIYILAPTAKNVDRIIADFSPAQSSSRKGAPPPSAGPKYAGAHLFFIDGLCWLRTSATLQEMWSDNRGGFVFFLV